MAADQDAAARSPKVMSHELARLAADQHRAALAIISQSRLQRVQALALRASSRSLRRRDRRARSEAAKLREEAQSLYGVRELTEAGSADRAAATSPAAPSL